MAADRHALLIGINEYPILGESARLSGSVNDALLMRDLLLERFGVAKANLDGLVDGEATQEAIRRKLEETYERLRENDEVFLFYAGHGSRIRDPGSPDGMLESMVASDSGRGDRPNRDIVDVEIDQWVQRVNAKTPHVTLIFDCCHSGSVTRDLFGARTREAEPDLRATEEMFAGAAPPVEALDLADRARQLERRPGYLRGKRRALVLAACRAEEVANEHIARESGSTFSHGAFTYFLGRALARAEPGISWRDLMDEVAPGLTSVYARQHPQIEGNPDQLVFERGEARPLSHLKVFEVDGARVGLAGGAAHGVARGSSWTIHPPTARHAGGEPLARMTVTEVAAATAHGEVEGDAEAAAGVQAGHRAFLDELRLPAPGLRVALDPAIDAEGARLLTASLENSSLLELADAGEPADAKIYSLAARDSAAAGDPCPHLGAMAETTWGAVGADGRLLVRLRAADATGASDLVSDLGRVARYRGLLAIAPPAGADALAGVTLAVERRRRGLAEPLEPRRQSCDGLPTFVEGELADFVVTNGADRPVWVSLVQFGCDFEIEVLIPDRHDDKKQGYPLEPGADLRAGAYFAARPGYPPECSEGLPLSLPEGFPWAAEPGEAEGSGLVHLKLMVTTEPASFDFVLQRGVRDLELGGHPLQEMVAYYGGGEATRSFRPPKATGVEWTTVTRTLAVRARESPG